VIFLIAGGVLLLSALGLLLGARGQQTRLAQMASVETSSSAAIEALASSVAGEIGSGSFNETVEVKGVIECENPLIAELSETPCVYYSMRVTREYEESYWETDQKGNRSQRTRRGSERVASNSRSTPFYVRDAAGRIRVEPEGAKLFDEKVLSRFESGGAPGRIGSFDLSGLLAGAIGGRRTLGYRFEESALPIERKVYVLGEAADSEGRLRIQKPAAKGTAFVISLKSEEQLAQRAHRTIRGLQVGAAAAFVLAAVSIVMGLLRG